MEQISTKSAAVMAIITVFVVLLVVWIVEENRKQALRLEPCRETFTANSAVLASMGVIAVTTVAAQGTVRRFWEARGRRWIQAAGRWLYELSLRVSEAFVMGQVAR